MRRFLNLSLHLELSEEWKELSKAKYSSPLPLVLLSTVCPQQDVYLSFLNNIPTEKKKHHITLLQSHILR